MLGVVTPFISGCLFYYICCPDVTAVIMVDRVLGFSEGVHLEIKNSNVMYEFTRSYLLDMLWAFSLQNCVYLIMSGEKRRVIKSISFTLPLIFVVEFMQYCEIRRGTFDLNDIVMEMTAVIVALVFETGAKIDISPGVTS